MTFINMFLKSLTLPRKRSVFKLNRITMDIAVIYMFMLIAIASIPALIEQINSIDTLAVQVHTFFYVLFFFMFHYLIVTTGLFILISIYAYIGTKVATLTNRRLHFAILWKVIAFSMTGPLIIYTIISLFYTLPNFVIIFFLIYTFIILLKVISVYPPIKKQK